MYLYRDDLFSFVINKNNSCGCLLLASGNSCCCLFLLLESLQHLLLLHDGTVFSSLAGLLNLVTASLGLKKEMHVKYVS